MLRAFNLFHSKRGISFRLQRLYIYIFPHVTPSQAMLEKCFSARVKLTSSETSVWTESSDSWDPRRAALSLALRVLFIQERGAHHIQYPVWYDRKCVTYLGSTFGSLERRVFLIRFISSGCLLLLLRIAQSSKVSAASYFPWRLYSAPRFYKQ